MKKQNADTQKSPVKKALVLLGKTVLTLAGAAFIYFAGSLVSLLLMAEDISFAVVLAGMYALPALLLPVIWLKNKKKWMKIWLAAAVLYFVVLGGNFGLLKYDDTIRINTSAYCEQFENYPYYVPFREDTKLVRLDGAALQLSEPLPAVDGAAALMPVYGAFMEAVYPETADMENGLFQNSNGSAFEYVSKWGYIGLAEKESDVYFDLYPREETAAYAQPYGTAFEYTPIGAEAFVFFVHKDHPVDDLTSEQLRGIYSGKITNWKDVGGANRAIKAYQSDSGSCSQKLMERFMGETALMNAPMETINNDLYRYEDVIAAYRNKPNAIGFSTHYLVAGNPDIKLLSVDGVAPTRENIQNGSYQLVTPVYAVTRGDETDENVGLLIDWILSEEGQYVVEESGYFGV